MGNEQDGWQVVPCADAFGERRFMLVKPDEVKGSLRYQEYSLGDLVDGTLVEVPMCTYGNLLINTNGVFEIGIMKEMTYRSYFLRTMDIQGTKYRVLKGVFGDGICIDSFVLSEDTITCQIVVLHSKDPKKTFDNNTV